MIIHLPADIDIVALSATVSNAEEVAAWIADRARRDRDGDRGAAARRARAPLHGRRPGRPSSCTCCRRSSTHDGRAAARTRSRPGSTRATRRGARGQRRRRLYTPWRTEVVERLAEERMLPAIVFVFSRNGCDQAVEQCLAAGIRLTDSAERRAACARSPSSTSTRSPTTTSTCSATTRGSPAWRPASPRTTPAWCRR